ncbi:MAG: class I SAM-dependent methyltransferase [Candidatus Eisenbacteria bacterium]
MGSAEVHGSLWGAKARDYAETVEAKFAPVYERILGETSVGPGTTYLDVGCGPGLAAHLATRRGARVAGLDAAATSIAIARERTAAGDFRVGEMEELPWDDGSFGVVTGFNSFQFASDFPHAVREGNRVLEPGGRMAIVVWGPDKDVAIAKMMSAIRNLLPPTPPNPQPPFSTPGRIEAVMEQAGMAPRTSGDMEWVCEFPDLPSALRSFFSTGGIVSAVQQVGAKAVSRAITESLAQFRTREGGYRLRNVLRYVIGEKAPGSRT